MLKTLIWLLNLKFISEIEKILPYYEFNMRQKTLGDHLRRQNLTKEPKVWNYAKSIKSR